MRARNTTPSVGVRATLTAILLGAIGIFHAAAASAQQVTVGNRFTTAHDSFFENNSISWSGNYRGVNFSFGAPGLSQPAFGGFDRNAGLSTNFGINGKDGNINFAMNFGQGYQQSLTTQAPSVTLMNGQAGFISDTSQTPFVISVIPVVGAQPFISAPMISPFAPVGPNPRLQDFAQAHADAQAQAAQAAQNQAQAPNGAQAPAGGQNGAVPPPPQPGKPAPQRMKLMNVAEQLPDAAEAAAARLDGAQQSTAGRPALSVAEAKRLHEQEQAGKGDEMSALMERARALEEDGKPNVARIYYQRVAKNGSGELQQQAQAKLYELQGSAKP